MDFTSQPSRPPLKQTDMYRPRLGAQNPPRWKTDMIEREAWRAVSSPSICPSQTADADAQNR
jgi:hypothetical protein